MRNKIFCFQKLTLKRNILIVNRANRADVTKSRDFHWQKAYHSVQLTLLLFYYRCLCYVLYWFLPFWVFFFNYTEKSLKKNEYY